jgi:hypothetical protein
MKNLDEKLKMVQIKHYEQMIKRSKIETECSQRESEVRIAKYKAEREKLNKDTRYYPIKLIIAAISAVSPAVGPILVVFLTK